MKNSNRPMTEKHLLLKLFFSTMYISAFTFGGGFVIITFMKKKFVDKLHWISDEEMLDIAAIAQSSPGAIAVNAAILIGWHMYGFLGMILSVAGTIIPPLFILSIVSLFYTAFSTNLYVSLLLKGMQAGIAAVILDAVFSLGTTVIQERKVLNDVLMLVAFVATFVFGINVIYIILLTALLGIFLTFYKKVKGGQRTL